MAGKEDTLLKVMSVGEADALDRVGIGGARPPSSYSTKVVGSAAMLSPLTLGALNVLATANVGVAPAIQFGVYTVEPPARKHWRNLPAQRLR